MNKRMIFGIALTLVLLAGVMWAQTYISSNYMEPGGSRWVIGGSLDVASGGDLDIESGGSIKLSGTAVTSTAAELNLLDGVSGLVQADLTKLAAIDSTAAELNLLNAVAGLVQADLTKLAAIDSTATELNLLNAVAGLVQADLTKLAAVDATAIEINKTNGIGATAYLSVADGISFTEDGSGTSYTGTVEIPAGAVVHDVCFTSTVLWDGTSASLDIGDDDDPNGWFAAVNLKITDLAVGEVLCAADDGTWGGKNGVYLTAAGRRGRVTAGVDSGWYYGAASEVIFVVTPGAADGSAGRSFGWVSYSVPTFTASTNL